MSKVIINSHSSGTLKLVDGLSNGAVATTTLTSSGACFLHLMDKTYLHHLVLWFAGTHAVSVFTSSGVVVDGQTITIGTTVYRAKAIPETLYDVAMGENAEHF